MTNSAPFEQDPRPNGTEGPRETPHTNRNYHPVSDDKDPHAKLRALAETGDAWAQWSLGERLESEWWFIVKDGRYSMSKEEIDAQRYKRDEAIKWLRASASQNYWRAQGTLAGILEKYGEGSASEIKSLRIQAARGAAEEGIPSSQLAWSHILMAGERVPQDKPEAIKWLRKAAERDENRGHGPAGDADAQWELAEMLRIGELIPRDEEEAGYWYRQSASPRDPYEETKWLEIYQEGRMRKSVSVHPAPFWRRGARVW